MRWLIYGANGYTGQLIVERAAAVGVEFAVGGRRPDPLIKLGQKHGCDVEIFDLSDSATVAAHLKAYDGVLHCAGPFSKTARPMLDACMKSGTHYLDITGEIDVFEMIFGRREELIKAGIYAIPGVGFDVVPTDAVAGALAAKLPQATHLTLGFRASKFGISQGTARTAFESIGRGGKIRSGGKIKRIGATSDVTELKFDPDDKSATLSLCIPWGDVSTAFYQTGIPNIKVYSATTKGQVRSMRFSNWMSPILKFPGIRGMVERRLLPKGGPSRDAREQGHMWVYGEATDGFRSVICRLKTPEGYHLTALAGVESLVQLGLSNLAPGAYTPTQAFGPDFVTTLPGVSPLRFEEAPTMEVSTTAAKADVEIGAIEVPDPGPTIH